MADGVATGYADDADDDDDKRTERLLCERDERVYMATFGTCGY